MADGEPTPQQQEKVAAAAALAHKVAGCFVDSAEEMRGLVDIGFRKIFSCTDYSATLLWTTIPGFQDSGSINSS